MRQATEESLRRLGVEALDLTQLHCIPMAALKQGDVFDWLRELKQEGKIRNWGASVESMDEALVCLEQEGLASLQIIFNIFRQKPIQALFPQAQAKGVAIIVRLPLASGLLSGKFTAGTRFAASDHRNYNRDGQAFNVGETFAGLPFEKGVELADGLKPMVPVGPEHGADGAAVDPGPRGGVGDHPRGQPAGAGAQQRCRLGAGAAGRGAARQAASLLRGEGASRFIRGPY